MNHQASRLTPLKIIWHRKLIVSLMIVAGIVAALLLSLVLPKSYTRSCAIVVEPATAKALADGVSMDSYRNTQAELITKSTAIHANALTILMNRGQVALKTFGDGHDKLSILRRRIGAVCGRNDDIITVSFDSPYSDEAAYIVSAVVEAYNTFTSDEKQKPNETALAGIRADQEKKEKQIHEQNSKMADLEGQISQLQAQEVAGNADARGLAALAEELTRARVKTIDAKDAFERAAKSLIGDSAKIDELFRTGQFNGVSIAPGGDEAQIKAELSAAETRLGELKERYLPNHPAVQGAQRKTDDLNARYVLLLHQRWTSASERARLLEAGYEQQKQRTAAMANETHAKLAARLTEFNEAKESLSQDKAATSLMAAREQELTSPENLSPVRTHVLAEPDPMGPPDKISPSRIVLLIEGLLAGLVLGLTLALADPRVRSSDEVIAATNLPILGIVPHMGRSLNEQGRGRKMHLDPLGEAAEAYRAIRAAVCVGPRIKSILVTSAMHNDGKSTLAANLSIAMAEAGQRVLLLDADLRAPMQHRIFAAAVDAGVSSVIAGRSPIAWAIQSTGIRGLDLMPCGPVPFNPSETINNQMLANLLVELGRRYDHIVIDSPPVMVVTDARILGAMCDGTLLVVRAQRSSRRGVAEARDGLLGFGANLVGVIINDGPSKRHRYGYNGGNGKRALMRVMGSYGANGGRQPATTGALVMLNKR